MNSYVELKTKHQKEINEFPLGFAFNKEQFAEMMAKWNLTPEDTDKIYSIGGGGYIRKSDEAAFDEMLNRHAKEVETARRENKDDYLYHMFCYELANHEYSYTGDISDTLDALGLTTKEIAANGAMNDAFVRAIRDQI